MKKLFVCFLLFYFIGSNICLAESKASYVFRRDQPKEYVFEQTVNILQNYNFPIISLNPGNGYIETDFTLINRGFLSDFRLKYAIRIEQKKYGTRMDVLATAKENDPEFKPSMRTEIKSAWWIIKMVVKRIGK